MARKSALSDEDVTDLVEFARRLVRDKQYQSQLMIAAREGKLTDRQELMFWAYAAGRPVEKVQHEDVTKRAGEDLTELSDDELAQRALQIAEKLQAKMGKAN